MTRPDRLDLDSVARDRRQAVGVAEAFLNGGVGVIEGARQLSSLAHAVVDDWRVDPDFLVFGAIDTETDHLPVGKVRELWDPAALVEKDAVVQRIEAEERSAMEAACRNVLLRFRDV